MAYATVGDLIKAFREDERDNVAPFMWSDAQLERFANEALIEFAEQTKSIYDDETEAAVIDYRAGEQDLDLHPAVIDVIEAYAGDFALRITAPGVVRRSALPSGGRPELLVLNLGSDRMRMYPAPATAGTLELLVVRKPLVEVRKSDSIPDVPADERRHLLLFIKHRAYNVADADIFDATRAAQFLAEFERACQGVYESALRRRSSVSQGIRFRW